MTEYVHVYSDVTDLKKYELMELTNGILRPSHESHFEGIKPIKVSGNRFILISKDGIVSLDKNMATILADEKKAEDSMLAKQKLMELDLEQIRPIAEYIAAKQDAPQTLIDLETAKEAERLKIWD